MLRSVLSSERYQTRVGVAPAPMAEVWRQAEESVGALPPYAVSADRRLRAAVRGAHARRRAGPGDAFWQFRPYEPGESASRIDWRRSARSDALYVRQQEWETAQSVWLWVDGSPSMHFRSKDAIASKSDRAAVLALAVAKLLIGAGERVGLYGVDERPAGGQYGLSRLREGLARMRLEDTGSFPAPRAIPRFSRLFLLGDFLGEEGPTRAALDRLVPLGVDGHMLQILDPVEEDFPFRGRITFEGLESDDSVLINRSDGLGSAYRRHLKAWVETLRNVSRRVGWTHSLHRTDHSAVAALFALISLTGRTA